MNIHHMEDSAEHTSSAPSPFNPVDALDFSSSARNSDASDAVSSDGGGVATALESLLPRLNDAELRLLHDQLRQVARRTRVAVELRAILARLTLDSLVELAVEE